MERKEIRIVQWMGKDKPIKWQVQVGGVCIQTYDFFNDAKLCCERLAYALYSDSDFKPRMWYMSYDN